jgi:hypothetical protein
LLDCRHVCKTCAFHDALQAGKQKEVHLTPLIWRLLVGNFWTLPHRYKIMKRHIEGYRSVN